MCAAELGCCKCGAGEVDVMRKKGGHMTHTIDDSRIEELRDKLVHGEGIGQQELSAIVAELTPAKDDFRPKDKMELLPLFDRGGHRLGTTAPRWICHLLALRHRCAHILIIWKNPVLEDVLVLQIRDWNKDDSPGHVDISVGGHMITEDSNSAEDTAFAEMLQETGLTPSDLDTPLEHVGGYPFDESCPNKKFYNSEWRDVYIGRVKQESFGKIRFPDGEVAALVLVPLRDAQKLLRQDIIPMASALAKSLPKCIEYLHQDG